jgi:phosphoribosylaminoimidazolecarboxamide formyltransferase/IMP cyclohydrolase
MSVYDKTGLVELAKNLVKHGLQLVASGGTAEHLHKQHIPVIQVSEYTGSPEMPNGLVKTLHPKIHAGILGDWNNPDQRKYLEAQHVPPVDYVIVNLYPFAETIKQIPQDLKKAVDNVDIGGPALMRAAAKGALLNHRVVPITNPKQYSVTIKELDSTGHVSDSTRERFAYEAFNQTANYDTIISDYFKSIRKT